MTVHSTVTDSTIASVSIRLIKTGSAVHTRIRKTNAPLCKENAVTQSIVFSMWSPVVNLFRNVSKERGKGPSICSPDFRWLSKDGSASLQMEAHGIWRPYG